MTERLPLTPVASPVDALEGPEPIEERLALGGRDLRSHTARGAIVNSLFSIGFTLLGLLQRLAVAVFLTASEFGLWGLLVATLVTLVQLKEVGISQKYVQQTGGDQEIAFQKAFTLELLYSLLFWVLILAALPLYAVIYGQWDILFPGFILSLALIASSLQAPIWIAYRQMRFVRQRTLEALNPVVSTVVMVALAASGAGYWALVIGVVAGSLAAAAGALITSPYRIRFRFDRQALGSYFSFSWPLFIARASTLVVAQGAVIVGNYTVGLVGLGALALAATFSTYVDRLDDIIRQTIYPAVCAVKDRRELLFEAFAKSNRLAMMWGIPFGIGLALFAPDLITFVLGEKWREAEFLLQAFGLILGFRQVAFNWNLFINALGDTRPLAISGALSVITFVVPTVPLMLWLDLEGYALGTAIGLVAQLFLRTYYLRNLFTGFRMLPHLIRGLAPSIPATLAVVAVRELPDVGERTAGIALAELTLYLVVTALATLIFERRLIAELVGYLRRPSQRLATT